MSEENILKIYQRLNNFYEKVSAPRLFENSHLEELANCRNEYFLEKLIMNLILKYFFYIIINFFFDILFFNNLSNFPSCCFLSKNVCQLLNVSKSIPKFIAYARASF